MSEEIQTTNQLVNLVVAKDNSPVNVNGLNLRLQLLDGWDELDDLQQKYLFQYAKNPNSKNLTAMNLGISTRKVQKWFSQEKFAGLARQIDDIYTDILKGIDYEDAISNSKIRARVIKARENRGSYTEKKETKHNHLHVGNADSLSALLKALS